MEQISEEIRLAVKSLDSPIRQAILVLLKTNVELSFSDIQEELGLDKVKLNFHLKNLFSSALVDHFYRHEVGNPKYSYYSLSRLGKRVLANLIQAFIPPSPIQRIAQAQTYFEKLRAHDSSENPVGHPLDLARGGIEYIVPTTAHSGAKIETLEPPSNNAGRYLRLEQWVI